MMSGNLGLKVVQGGDQLSDWPRLSGQEDGLAPAVLA